MTLPASELSEDELLRLVACPRKRQELDRDAVVAAGRSAWAWRGVDEEITSLLRPLADDDHRRA